MAERRKTKRKADRQEQTPCTKEEYAVAKHLRFNTPAHEGRMAGMTVKCFVASDAVNCLLDSKWAKGKVAPDSDIMFSDRKSAVAFLNKFLAKGLFHRADKVDKKKDREKRKKKKEAEEKEKEKEKEKDKESATEEKKSKKERKKQAEKEAEELAKEAEKKKEEKKNKTRKFKLNMSEDQRFVDGNSIYVWIYDPIHPKTFLIGFLMLIGAAALCLFPLWPDWMRIGVYYTSLLGASFVGFMLFLIVFRVIIFSIVWVLTFGKHHFWIFPNLTEDVGIIDSFRPLLKHDVFPPPSLEKTDKDKTSEKDNEENDSEPEEKPENGDFEIVDGDEDGESDVEKVEEESGENEDGEKEDGEGEDDQEDKKTR